MEKAIALKFGGEEVLAKECSSSDFYDLGLICPSCRELVMHVNGYEKNDIKGNKINVSPFFRHYNDFDSVHSKNCDLRVRQLSDSFWENVKSKGQWQRRRVFQKYLWIIVCQNTPTLANMSQKKIDKLLDQKYYVLVGKNEYEKEKSFVDLYQKVFLDALENNIHLGHIDSLIDQVFNVPLEEIASDDHRDYFDSFRKKVGNARKSQAYQRLHKSICIEVVNFMTTESGKLFFKKMTDFLFVLAYSRAVKQNFETDLFNNNTSKNLIVVHNMLQALSFCVSIIHWSEEIGNRMNLEKASPLVASRIDLE